MASRRLHLAPSACNTCPYRRDTPTGVWHPDEYAKLAEYDRDWTDDPELGAFHCHQEHRSLQPTVCRGWLAVHPDSPAVRMSMVHGRLDQYHLLTMEADGDLYGDEYYATGTEARDAGLAGCDSPDEDAQATMDRLARQHGGVGVSGVLNSAQARRDADA